MKICILGTGAYGLALAIALNKNSNNEIMMWTKLPDEKKLIDETRRYDKVLPGIVIPDEIKITTDLKEATDNSSLIICAIPIAFVSSVFTELKDYYNDQTICIATKGIEQNTNKFVSEITNEIMNSNKIAVLSGASFAIDTVGDFPIGLTIASQNIDSAMIIKEAFSNTNINIELSSDVIGTEICGSIKNVIAIGCGMLNGLQANESTKAMFITRSFNEIINIINNMNGFSDTGMTYAGIGDFLLTCTSSKSRNFSYGVTLATKSKEEIIEYENSTTIEGRYTLVSIIDLCKKYNISSPIIETIYDIIYNDKDINELFNTLVK